MLCLHFTWDNFSIRLLILTQQTLQTIPNHPTCPPIGRGGCTLMAFPHRQASSLAGDLLSLGSVSLYAKSGRAITAPQDTQVLQIYSAINHKTSFCSVAQSAYVGLLASKWWWNSEAPTPLPWTRSTGGSQFQNNAENSMNTQLGISGKHKTRYTTNRSSCLPIQQPTKHGAHVEPITQQAQLGSPTPTVRLIDWQWPSIPFLPGQWKIPHRQKWSTFDFQTKNIYVFILTWNNSLTIHYWDVCTPVTLREHKWWCQCLWSLSYPFNGVRLSWGFYWHDKVAPLSGRIKSISNPFVYTHISDWLARCQIRH